MLSLHKKLSVPPVNLVQYIFDMYLSTVYKVEMCFLMSKCLLVCPTVFREQGFKSDSEPYRAVGNDKKRLLIKTC